MDADADIRTTSNIHVRMEHVVAAEYIART